MAFIVYLENEKKRVVDSYGPLAISAHMLQFVLGALNDEGIIVIYGPGPIKYVSDSERDLLLLKKAIVKSDGVLSSKERLPDGRRREYINLVEGYKIRSELQHWIV